MSGRGAAVALAFWALLLAALGGLFLFWGPDLLRAVLLPASALLVVLLAVAALRARDAAVRRVPEASGGAVLAAAGIAMLAVGLAVGAWAAWLALWLAIVALWALGRERLG